MRRVLIVEDTQSLGELVCAELERRGCTVVWTTSVADALWFLRRPPHNFDAVLSDYELPEENGQAAFGKGTTVLQEAMQLTPRPKTILWSGLDRTREVAAEMSEPPDHVCVKNRILETLDLLVKT